MIIQYNYKVIKVDEYNKVMDIMYTPQEPSTLGEYLVSARLPRTGEPLENVVQMFAPIGMWQQEAYEFETVIEGSEGSISCVIE
jgi:hypothetical protein